MYFRRILCLCVLLLFCTSLLEGCALKKRGFSQPPPGGRAKPYTVRGKTYYPLKSAHGFVEEGVASWYGKDFHGKKTANGERYDMYAMTAAHKLLPFGTHVRVTNLDNGRVSEVRVNDRGPFVNNRVIDLTKSAAGAIGMLGPGTARVRVESIGTVPGIHNNGDLDGTFYIQVGAFAQQGNASRLVRKLKNAGWTARSVYDERIELWRVQLGPWTNLYGAEKMLTAARRIVRAAFIVAD